MFLILDGLAQQSFCKHFGKQLAVQLQTQHGQMLENIFINGYFGNQTQFWQEIASCEFFTIYQRTFININSLYLQLAFYNIFMESFDQTCRKSQEVQARLRKLLQKKVQEKSIQQTLRKIEEAEATINSNKQNLLHLNQTYNKLQNKFGDFVDSAAQSVQVNTLPNAIESGFVPQHIQTQQLVQILKNGRRIMVLTGSSISSQSGLPLYKGQGYQQKELVQIDPQNIDSPIGSQILLTTAFFNEHPKLVWSWVSDFIDKKKKVEPTQQHYLINQIIQQLANQGKEISVVTQNIDNFHQQVQEQSRKKSKNYKSIPAYQIHGNITKIRCDFCSTENKELKYQPYQTYEEMIKMQSRLKCSSCFNTLRPHIMFNDQFSSEMFNCSQTVFNLASQADVLLVVGATILPGFTHEIILSLLQNKKTVIEINQPCLIKKINVKWIEHLPIAALQSIKSSLCRK